MERGKKEMEASIQRREKDIAELVSLLLDLFFFVTDGAAK